ncbi:riboflavin kinase-like [Corticium candelabrum]|uniref:riboflavin kinase-like n=1 Tax=Corticium candelabrum TaxID=121492 RepID=UPI002E2615D9|nr:riboflavin kinase-like [Corticium candelabrum]
MATTPDTAKPPTKPLSLPLYVRGTVVKGLGRGNKDLGIPTANLDDGAIASLPSDFDNGIYYGWASVDRTDVHKMVMSVGYNPHYGNRKKSMEAHLIHEFPEDFYGSELSIVVVDFLRDEKSFPSLEALIAAIHADINGASINLDRNDKYLKIKQSPFFQRETTKEEEGTTDAVPAST